MFRKIARPMLASVYVADGVDSVINANEHSDSAKAVIDRTKSLLPGTYASVIPDNPELVVKAAGATKITAGTLLALGKFQRLSAAALALTAVPTILSRHAFWAAEDGEEKTTRRNGFLTNVALLGGLLITVSDTQGKPDLVWRTRHAAKVTNKKMQSALPGKSETEKYLDQSREKAGEYAGAAKAAAATTAATASAKATGFWEDKGRDIYETAAEKAGEWFEEAEELASDYYDRAQSFVDDNKDDWLAAADSNAKAAKDRTVRAAKIAQQRADEAAKKASDEYGSRSKKARKASRKATKKADKARAKAVKKLQKKFGL
ncbi:DoxX family membrane protein [Corynebacterium mendelii]|uniref:DoxX family protein n=1 Tax=Corynebacterium mendelii TaxID=2765362 RepID=A0A939E344_9CORY|nr:DoxX family protein [Corynebacterium mendelii]MBN9644567.1 DoxX family protein [Corynebacterium mendelii]